jgi:hypothetical protein
MRIAAVLLIGLLTACAPGEPNTRNTGPLNELIQTADSAHHVMCYHLFNYKEGGVSCVALDSAHWYQRVER